MAYAFALLLSRDRQTLESVAAEMNTAWGQTLEHIDATAIERLRPTLSSAFSHDGQAADRFTHLALAFAQGDYAHALRLLLEHNAFIMESRNGSQPWARIEGGKLDVRYRDESGVLMPADELPSWWSNTYFINSLHTVVTTLRPS
jgi:hypothetical protein